MEKRLILAIILSVAVLITFQIFFAPKVLPKKPPAVKSAASAPVAAGTAPAAAPPAPAATPAAAPANASPTAEEVDETQAARQDTVIETELYSATLDNQGAILTRFVLNKFKDSGHGVELIPTTLPDNFSRFLSFAIPGDTALEKDINNRVFSVQRDTQSSASGKLERIVFRYQRTGLQVEKVISFYRDKPYLLRVAGQITKDGKPADAYIRLGAGLTNHDLVPLDKYHTPPQIVYYEGSSRETMLAEKINDEKEGQRKLSGSLLWAGVETKFFAAIVLPDNPLSQVLLTDQIWKYQNPEKPAEEPKSIHVAALLAPLPRDASLTVFIGPKSYEVLSSIREDLTKAIDYGWFAVIVKPLYYALRFIQGYIPNWGWSIIFLTFLITLALFPIRFYQMKSMKEMQKVQPQMKAIQAKYKGQKTAEARQKQNAELMDLYKEAGVNPMSGCLPMVVQLPFLIAFYNLIDKSIETWRQPFMLWIKDLSAADPTYVTPILMGLTMIIQMKQTPATPGQDAKMQKQMMYIMPIVMTVFFLNMASGLVIYFLFSNIFAWGIQKLVEEFFFPKVSGGEKLKVSKAATKR